MHKLIPVGCFDNFERARQQAIEECESTRTPRYIYSRLIEDEEGNWVECFWLERQQKYHFPDFSTYPLHLPTRSGE